MRLVHVSRELIPYWPPTPQARAAAELPAAQMREIHEVMVISQASAHSVEAYQNDPSLARRLSPLRVETEGGEVVDVFQLEGTLGASHLRVILLILPEHRDNVAFFGQAAAELLSTMPQRPDLVHLHGATGVPVDALRDGLGRTAVLQSVYDPRSREESLADAVREADAVIMPCRQLRDPALGQIDSPVWRALDDDGQHKVIYHGIDESRWNPARDPMLASQFAADSLSGRRACREALQKQLGFPARSIPILTVWSCGGRDGGLQDVTAIVPELKRLDIQMAIVPLMGGQDGTADSGEGGGGSIKDLLERSDGPPRREAMVPDQRALHPLLAGSDLVLIPDVTAPLGQRAQLAMRYGAVPVARLVQAHRDILVEHDRASQTGGAFLFSDPGECFAALERSVNAFGDREAWDNMMRANLYQELGWSRTASQLGQIYRKVLAK